MCDVCCRALSTSPAHVCCNAVVFATTQILRPRTAFSSLWFRVSYPPDGYDECNVADKTIFGRKFSRFTVPWKRKRESETAGRLHLYVHITAEYRALVAATVQSASRTFDSISKRFSIVAPGSSTRPQLPHVTCNQLDRVDKFSPGPKSVIGSIPRFGFLFIFFFFGNRSARFQ